MTSPILRSALTAALCLAACAAGCERKPKRVLRTEPWPAPSSAPGAVAPSGAPDRYVVRRGEARIDLRAKKSKPEATLPITGTIDVDRARPERTTATLEADLLALSVTLAGSEDAVLSRRALEWLELTPERPAAERERDRFARLDLLGFEAVPSAAEGEPAPRAVVTAHGNLTLHHFRVPVTLELAVEIGPPPEERLLIRTRRPLVVSLTAHDILPRDARGQLVPGGISALGSEVAREARITAELSAERVPPARTIPPNP